MGDDDQSIYGFRGARPEVMLRFQDFYPDVKFVRMNTNYRSCSGIIKAADQLIKNNTSRFSKEFQAFHEEEGTVRQYVSKDRPEEILKVTAMIQELIQDGEVFISTAVRDPHEPAGRTGGGYHDEHENSFRIYGENPK